MSVIVKQVDLANWTNEDLQKESQLKQQLMKHFRTLKWFESDFSGLQKYYQQQRVLYLLLIYRKCFKLLPSRKLIDQLQTRLTQIEDKVSHQIGYKKQECRDIAQKICQKVPYAQNMKFQKKQDKYMSIVVREVCKKRKGFFDFQESFKYQKKDYQTFSNFFSEKFALLDLSSAKKRQKTLKQFSYDPQALYVLKLKQSFYFLQQKSLSKPENVAANSKQPSNYLQYNGQHRHQNNKSLLTKQYYLVEKQQQEPHSLAITEVKKCKLSLLKEYFPQQYQISKWNSNSDQSFIVPPAFLCSICNLKKCDFSLLSYNYVKYCVSCLSNPKVSTSGIPGNIIQKFLKESNINTNKYNIRCPQCKSVITLNNYSAANKPKAIKCGACEKRICLNHDRIIQQCFCYCLKCKTSTISVPSLNMNVCQDCGIKTCFKCGQKSQKFCSCICKNCLQLQSPGHECKKRCHSCKNHYRNLKQCSKCTLPICSGCFYLALDKQDGVFQKMKCSIIDYQ